MQHANGEPTSMSLAGVVFGGILMVVVIYFVPFLAVLLDEAFLQTYWCSKNLPHWMEKVFEVVYWPLLGPFGG